MATKYYIKFTGVLEGGFVKIYFFKKPKNLKFGDFYSSI